MSPLVRLRAGAGLGLAQLRAYPVRTALVVVAIALAVLATTLLAGVGVGVLETGTERFATADRDLWVTAGPTRIAPGQLGGVENAIVDAHTLAEELEAHEDVRNAAPLAYGTVYVGTSPDDLRTVVGVGVPGTGTSVSYVAGGGFSARDPHYAGGSYDGPMTDEVVIDPRLAELFGVGVGDTLHVGGTLSAARGREVTVVGLSPTFSTFLGTPTVTMPLSELQALLGTTGADRAAQLTVTLEDGADVETVRADLEARHPDLEIRTNREQLRAVLGSQARVLASAVVLVVLAVVAGVALTVNVLALLVHQQRRAFAAVKAAGISSWTLGGAVLWQALLVAGAGAGLGLALTPAGVWGLNLLAAELVGFGDLVRTPAWVYALGGGLAVGIGLFGGLVAAWRLAAIRPLAVLRDG